MNALNDMNQSRVEWDCGTTGLGVVVSDSLMFQRGDPTPSDPHLSQVYGLALPLLKRGMPVTPVQLENLTVTNYLDGFRLLLLSYHGQKPLSPEVHAPLAQWVKRGGVLVMVDDDTDPYNQVREWWNRDGHDYATPREHLLEQLGLTGKSALPEGEFAKVGKGGVLWLREDPAKLAANTDGDAQLVQVVKQGAARTRLKWRETNHLLLRRGPYLIAAGLDESGSGDPKELHGRFVNLFDPQLRFREKVKLTPGSRSFLLDLKTVRDDEPRVLASACKALPRKQNVTQLLLTVEGVDNTAAVVLVHAPKPPRAITLAGQPVEDFEYSAAEKLLWLRFANATSPRELAVQF
jgi:hypothetical protein